MPARAPLDCAASDPGAASGRVILGTWSKDKLSLDEIHRFANAFQSIGTNDCWNIVGLRNEIFADLPRGAKLASPVATNPGIISLSSGPCDETKPVAWSWLPLHSPSRSG